jgi:ATP-dependent Lon protease
MMRAKGIKLKGSGRKIGLGADRQPTQMDVPLLPLVNSVVFPRSIHPLSLQGEQARQLAESVQSHDGLVALFMQRDGAADPPTADDLHSVGTLARLEDVRQREGGVLDVNAAGLYRVSLLSVVRWEPYAVARVEVVPDGPDDEQKVQPLARQVRDLYREVLTASANTEASEKLLPVLDATDSADDLAYLISATLPISPSARQDVLEAGSPGERLALIVPLLQKAIEIQGNEPGARSLRSLSPDLEELAAALSLAGLPPEVERVAERELERLASLSATSPDYSLGRTYLQWLADVPWRDSGEPPIDLDHARAVLDEEHYGLDDVKQRIIEYLAVSKLRRERQDDGGSPETDASPGTQRPTLSREPILCLVGPPGIGKTSLGRSVASALDRPFVRISLGGVSDEAEIRGHQRTYLGAMPGKIIRSLARLETNHPVIMLDEIDKLGSDGKGDPASALLEVLDPEQQRGFLDHYLDVPFDLSNVFFIATANLLDTLSPALSDRLEIIQLSGYTEHEKTEIALRHIVPAQMEIHALHDGDATWEPEAILSVIRNYTREAGVRQLEREIATVCRRIATMLAQGESATGEPYRVDEDFISEVLGTPRYLPDVAEVSDQPGIATGVVWTPVGGDIIYVEASMMPGGRTLTITGQLGEVMRESAQAALSYVRSRAIELRIDPGFFESNDIHLHVPSGAVQKDGPSAGVTIAVALASLLTGVAVPSDLAMTGEITLRGRVLPVGGIKEKVLGARRAGMRRLVLPAQNRRDLEDLPAETVEGLEIVLVENMDDVLGTVGMSAQQSTERPRTTYAGRRRASTHREAISMPRVARPRRG